jgi:hypothetical protein
MPDPVRDPAIVAQVAFEDVDHEQVDEVVTVIVPLVPAGGAAIAVGDTAIAHGAACVTVKVCPPIVIVPLRDVVPVFAETLYRTLPLPLPLAPAVIVIHATLLADVHAQPVAAVIVTLPVTAADVVRFEEVGEMPGEHGGLNANVFERALGADPPGPTALTTDS